MSQGTGSENGKEGLAELLDLIAKTDEKNLTEQTVVWVFSNASQLLPGFLETLSNDGRDDDLVKALVALRHSEKEWIMDLDDGEAESVLDVLVKHLEDGTDDYTFKEIADVLKELPQKAVVSLFDNLKDNNLIKEAIKKMFEILEDC